MQETCLEHRCNSRGCLLRNAVPNWFGQLPGDAREESTESHDDDARPMPCYHFESRERFDEYFDDTIECLHHFDAVGKSPEKTEASGIVDEVARLGRTALIMKFELLWDLGVAPQIPYCNVVLMIIKGGQSTRRRVQLPLKSLYDIGNIQVFLKTFLIPFYATQSRSFVQLIGIDATGAKRKETHPVSSKNFQGPHDPSQPIARQSCDPQVRLASKNWNRPRNEGEALPNPPALATAASRLQGAVECREWCALFPPLPGLCDHHNTVLQTVEQQNVGSSSKKTVSTESFFPTVSATAPPNLPPYLHHVLLWLLRQIAALNRAGGRYPLTASTGSLLRQHMTRSLNLPLWGRGSSKILNMMNLTTGICPSPDKDNLLVSLPSAERWRRLEVNEVHSQPLIKPGQAITVYEGANIMDSAKQRSGGVRGHWVRESPSDFELPEKLRSLCACYTPLPKLTASAPVSQDSESIGQRELESEARDEEGVPSDSLIRVWRRRNTAWHEMIAQGTEDQICPICRKSKLLRVEADWRDSEDSVATFWGANLSRGRAGSIPNELRASARHLNVPRLTELFLDKPLISGAAAESLQLADGFQPLGGHGFGWTYSPYHAGTEFLVKRTLPTEGGFYAFLINQFRASLCIGTKDSSENVTGLLATAPPEEESVAFGSTGSHAEGQSSLSTLSSTHSVSSSKLSGAVHRYIQNQHGAVVRVESATIAPYFPVGSNADVSLVSGDNVAHRKSTGVLFQDPANVISPGEPNPGSSAVMGLRRSPSASSTLASESELVERLPLLQEYSEQSWLRRFGEETRREAIRGLLEFVPFVTGVILPEAAAMEAINGKKLLTNANSCFVEMENLTHVDPNVYSHVPLQCAIDIKIGTQLWGLDADESKRKRMAERAKNSTSGDLGVALIGYRVQSGEQPGDCRQVSREECRKVDTAEKFFASLEDFFKYASMPTLRKILVKLKHLLSWFTHYSILAHFYASSILIIYDSTSHSQVETTDTSESRACGSMTGTQPTEPTVKLIDFAHASVYHTGVDEGCSLGIRNLVHFLENFLKTRELQR